jgi:hypothetical protein
MTWRTAQCGDTVKTADHYLLVQTASGTSRYRVVETSKLQEGIAVVTILAGDWLDMGTYAATYQVGDKRAGGRFAVYECRSSIEQIRFVGTFTREGVTWV